MKKLYGIGIGPGDKELITLKAYNLIRNCRYVFLPANKGESLAGRIASEYIADKEVLEIDFPMGEENKDRYKNAASYIQSMLGEGEYGVFLTLGDPMTYSTYIYLMNELNKIDIDVYTVPGITSYGAAASILGLPVTLKGESFYLCDGEIDEEVLKKVNSIAVLKVNKNKEDIIKKLERNNFEYAYVKRCTQLEQKILYTKDEILNDNDYMSLIFGRRKQQ